MTLVDDDTVAEEPHLVYCEPTGPTGSVNIEIPATFQGGSVEIEVGGVAIHGTDFSLGTSPIVNSQLNGNIWTLDLPAGPSRFAIIVTALQDGVEPGGTGEVASEDVTFSWVSGQNISGVDLTGTAQVDVKDESEDVSLSVPVDSTYEFESPPGAFSLQTNPTGNTLCTTIRWEIDTNDSESADWYQAELGSDYYLEDEDTSTTLQFTETSPGSGIYRSNLRTVQNDGDFQLLVHAINDRILEGEETVKVKAIVPDLGVTTSEQTVTILEEYYDPRSEQDVASACSCSCTTCGDNVKIDSELSDGSATVVLANGIVVVQTESQDGSKPVLNIGLKVPAGKLVPETVDAVIHVIQPDARSDGSLKSLGRKLADTNALVTTNRTLEVKSSATDGDTLWFSVQTDLGDHLASWMRSTAGNPDGSSGITEQILPLEVLVHPNFPSGIHTPSELYSGWAGHTNYVMRDETNSSIAPGFAPGSSIAGIDRLLRDQKILVPKLPAGGGSSGGAVKFDTGSMLVRASGGWSWFEGNSGSSPGTQDILSGSDITDRYGNIRRFNSLGDMVERIDSAGNSVAYAYNSDGTLASITDPRGRLTTFSYFVDSGTGLDNVEIETVNVSGNQAANRTMVMSYDPYTSTSSGQFKIRYDDPDGPGSRAAREEVLSYGTNGQLSQVAVGAAGSPSHTTSFAYNSGGDGRLSSISYPDGSSVTLDLTRQQNALIAASYDGGTITSSDPRALKVASPGEGNPIPNYAVVTQKRSANSDPQRTIVQLDHRGRLLRSWDPKQVHALGLEDATSWGDTEFQILAANVDLSTEYEREPTTRDDLGRITGNDWGEVLQTTSPDPDKILVDGVLQSNGTAPRQTESYTYVNNNPVSGQFPLQTDASWTWDDTFDVLTSTTDATGNSYFQTVDTSGRVTQQRWEQKASIGQNPFNPLDVNADGYVSAQDSLLIINYVNNNGTTRVPADSSGSPYLDVDGDNWITNTDSALVIAYLEDPVAENEVPPEPVVAGQTDVTYVNISGLPNSLVAQETIKTDRASGDTVIDYEYFNTPSDPARHAKLKSITESAGTAIVAVTSFLYDDRGNVRQITDPAGRVTEIFYDSRDRLTARLTPDPDGTGSLLPVLTRHDYDVFDNVIATEQINSVIENGQLVVTALTGSYTYDSGNRLTAEITQNPNLTWYLYRDSGGDVARTNSKATALAGTALSAADLTSYAESNQPIANAPIDDASYQGLKTSYSYYSTPNVVSVTETDMTAGTPSSTERTTHTTLDRLDRVSKFVSPDPGSGLTTTASDRRENGGFVTSWEYDNLGNQLSVTDGLDNSVSYDYDALNRVIKTLTPHPTTGSAYETQYAYAMNNLGWEVAVTDPSGIETVAQQDALGRLRTIIGDVPTQNTRYWTDGTVRSATDQHGNVARFDYDQRGRLTTAYQPRPEGTVASPEVGYQYTVDGLLTDVTDPLGRVTSYSYDEGGRLTRLTQPDPDGTGSLQSAYTDYVYDSLGNTVSTSDALAQTNSFERDAWYRVIASTDPSSATTSTSFDVFGNVLDVTDPLGNETVYTYNRLNQLVTEGKVYGSGTENRSHSYDGAGNLRSLTDRNDRLTEWDYDNRYRVTSETWKTGTTTDRTLTYAYDTSDRTTSVADSEPLATDFEFAYNDRSQLLAERQLTGLVGTSVVLDRSFDGNGNRITLGANFGGTLSGSSIIGGIDDFTREFAYDGLNRLTSVNSSSVSGARAVAPKLATFEYNAASQRTDLRRYSATTASSTDLEIHSRRAYDEAGRLTSITHGTAEIASGETWNGTSSVPASLGSTDMLAGYSFGYDQDNRLVDLSSYRDGTETSYGYDSRDQLTSASTAAISGLSQPFGLASSESYDFDAGGNRKSSSGTSQSAAGTHNQLQTDGTYNYTYDDEGNTLTKTSIASGEVTEYEWDHRNRLVLVTERVSAAGSITQQVKFVYDAFDQRVGKRVDVDGDGTWDRDEAFVWADGQTVLRFEDSDGEGTTESFRVANRYLYGDVVDEILADEQYTDGSGPAVDAGSASTTAGETLWTIADHLGSVRDLVDNNGTVRQHVIFDSFGNRLVEQDYDTSGNAISSSHADAVDTLFGYTGRDWDADVELQNNRARWYDPTTGRWLSQDPIGFNAGDANLYRYVGNQATTLTDPSGLVPPIPQKYASDPEFREGFDRATGADLVGGWLESWLYPRTEEARLREQLGQVAVDIAGIADPTPFCDGASGLISLKNGDFVGAGISVASMVPWIGDLAKAGKAPRLLEIVRNAVQVATKDARFASNAKPLLDAIRSGAAGVLNNSSLRNCLPESVIDNLSQIRKLVDDLYAPKKPSLSAHKEALGKVHEEVGKLPKGSPGKFGSPQAGTTKKGYRLDPPHPNAKPGTPETGYHFNWWDWTGGKKGKGGRFGATPIEGGG